MVDGQEALEQTFVPQTPKTAHDFWLWMTLKFLRRYLKITTDDKGLLILKARLEA